MHERAQLDEHDDDEHGDDVHDDDDGDDSDEDRNNTNDLVGLVIFMIDEFISAHMHYYFHCQSGMIGTKKNMRSIAKILSIL